MSEWEGQGHGSVICELGACVVSISENGSSVATESGPVVPLLWNNPAGPSLQCHVGRGGARTSYLSLYSLLITRGEGIDSCIIGTCWDMLLPVLTGS